MDFVLIANDLELLAFFHEQTTRFDETNAFADDELLTALAWAPEQLERSLSYLRAHELIKKDNADSGTLAKHFLSIKGETFVRRMEHGLVKDDLLKPGQTFRHTLLRSFTGDNRDFFLQCAVEQLAGRTTKPPEESAERAGEEWKTVAARRTSA